MNNEILNSFSNNSIFSEIVFSSFMIFPLKPFLGGKKSKRDFIFINFGILQYSFQDFFIQMHPIKSS
jgi:hypothetical protein